MLTAVDPARVRQEIAAYVGPLTVEADAEEIRLYNEKGHAEVALLRAAGAAASFCGSGGSIVDLFAPSASTPIAGEPKVAPTPIAKSQDGRL